jgi:aminopeptidase N
MYDKGQLILNTLRSVLDDDALWFSILHGIQDTFKYQNASADDIFGYINRKSGKDLSYLFDQYFKHPAIPRLIVEMQKEGDPLTARYRWETDVSNFRMPVKVTTGPDKFEFITPTAEWQSLPLPGMKPEDFKVAENLFYVNVQVR